MNRTKKERLFPVHSQIHESKRVSRVFPSKCKKNEIYESLCRIIHLYTVQFLQSQERKQWLAYQHTESNEVNNVYHHSLVGWDAEWSPMDGRVMFLHSLTLSDRYPFSWSWLFQHDPTRAQSSADGDQIGRRTIHSTPQRFSGLF